MLVTKLGDKQKYNAEVQGEEKGERREMQLTTV